MESEIVYERTTAAQWPAPDGTEVEIQARYGGGAHVGLTWQRSDLADKSLAPQVMVLEVEDLRAILAAIDERTNGSEA